jgi:hypothetical protein
MAVPAAEAMAVEALHLLLALALLISEVAAEAMAAALLLRAVAAVPALFFLVIHLLSQFLILVVD